MLNVYKRPKRLTPVQHRPGKSPIYRKLFRRPQALPVCYNPEQALRKRLSNSRKKEDVHGVQIGNNICKWRREKEKMASKIPPLILKTSSKTAKGECPTNRSSVDKNQNTRSEIMKSTESSDKDTGETDWETIDDEQSANFENSAMKTGELSEEAFAKEYSYGRRRPKVFEEMDEDEKEKFLRSEYHMNTEQIQELTFRPKMNTSKSIRQTYAAMGVYDWCKSNKNPKPEIVARANASPRRSIVSVTPSYQRKDFMLSRLQGAVYHDLKDVYGNSPRDDRQKQFFEKLSLIQVEEENRQLEMMQKKERKRLESTLRQREQLKQLREKYELDAWRRFMTQYVTSKVMEYEQSDRKEYGLPNYIDTDIPKKDIVRIKTPSKEKANKRKYEALFNVTPRPNWKLEEKPLKFEGFDTVFLDTEYEGGDPEKKQLIVSQLMKDASRLLKDMEDADVDPTHNSKPNGKGEYNLKRANPKGRKHKSRDRRGTLSDRTSPVRGRHRAKNETLLRRQSLPLLKASDEPKDKLSSQSSENISQNKKRGAKFDKILKDDKLKTNFHTGTEEVTTENNDRIEKHFTELPRRDIDNTNEQHKGTLNRDHSADDKEQNKNSPSVSEQKHKTVNKSEIFYETQHIENTSNADLREKGIETKQTFPNRTHTLKTHEQNKSSVKERKVVQTKERNSKEHVIIAPGRHSESSTVQRKGSKSVNPDTQRNKIRDFNTMTTNDKKRTNQRSVYNEPDDFSENRNSNSLEKNQIVDKTILVNSNIEQSKITSTNELQKTLTPSRESNAGFPKTNETSSDPRLTPTSKEKHTTAMNRRFDEAENETILTNVQTKNQENDKRKQLERNNRNAPRKSQSNIILSNTKTNPKITSGTVHTSQVNQSSLTNEQVSETGDGTTGTSTPKERIQKVQWKDLVEKYLSRPVAVSLANADSDDDDESIADIFERAIRRHALKMDEEDSDTE